MIQFKAGAPARDARQVRSFRIPLTPTRYTAPARDSSRACRCARVRRSSTGVGAQSIYGMPPKDLIYRFQRVSPMEASPHDSKTLYYGSQYLHRTRDEGVTWERISPDLTWNPSERQQKVSGEPITIDVTGEEIYSTLYAIRESPLRSGVIWTGANDGPFNVTRDGGKTWRKVTPVGQPQGCRVQNIEPSPHRAASAYYAALCYQLGDFRPFIWRTDDYGASWKLLTTGTNGIPADRSNESRAGGSESRRAALCRNGVRHVRLVRQRLRVAAAAAQSSRDSDHGHEGAPRRSRHLHSGEVVLDSR